MAEYLWYIVGEYSWYIMAECLWYIIGRSVTVSTGTSLTTTWMLIGGTITVPSTAAQMRVQFINQTNAGWLAVDDLSVSSTSIIDPPVDSMGVKTVDDLSISIVTPSPTIVIPSPNYEWGFETEGGCTTSTQPGFGNTTSFYRGGSGIAAPRTGSSAYAISNLANGTLVSETMPVAPNASFPVSAYLHGEMDSVGSEGNWQINACFYKLDNTLSSCSLVASGSAPAANWTQVSGTVTSPADALTMKLELVGAQLSGWLAWDDVSVSLNVPAVIKYYYAGSQRVAMRKNGVLNYLLGDHLGSASVVTDAGGSLLSKMLYKPWGETRYTSGVMPTDRLYTGQIAEAGLGLYFYNARWYDSSLSRFVQADTIIPEPGNPQSWDRYSYVNNSPLMYTDPSGHQAWAGEGGDNVGSNALAALYQRTMQTDYDWRFSGLWTLQEVKEVRQAAQNIGAYIGSFGGNGQKWIKAHLGGVTFAKERFIKYPIRAMNGGYTYLEFSLNEEIVAGAFVFPSNKITFQNSSINSQTVVHELGHTLDNWLGSSTVFEAAIFGGGWSDALIQYLGGQPSGLRCSSKTPFNDDGTFLPVGDYGMKHQADFFAQTFKYQVYGYPGNMNGGTSGMWMRAFIGVTVNMLP